MQRQARGFTLIELLVVVAIIGLLMSLLLPGLQKAREQGRKAKCLANLKSLATAAVGYSVEDSKDLIIPIHQSMVHDVDNPELWSADDHYGGGTRWLWRTAMWYAWGGRSTDQRFLVVDNQGYRFSDDSPFAARTRPLNRFLYDSSTLVAPRDGGRPIPTGEAYDMPVYHCPSDMGFPQTELVDDSPPGNVDRPCYDTLGNSYRASLNTVALGSDDGYSGAFSMGPWGQMVTVLPDPGRLVLLGEPLFFNVIGVDDFVHDDDFGNKIAVLLRGWHDTLRYSNLAFCDGSARWTPAEGLQPLPDGLVAPYLDDGTRYQARGGRFRLDVFPSPGARIWGPRPEEWIDPESMQKWPFRGYVSHLR
jgi:prepilin-type N-terminal cleavage/methylation domain-containing protein